MDNVQENLQLEKEVSKVIEAKKELNVEQKVPNIELPVVHMNRQEVKTFTKSEVRKLKHLKALSYEEINKEKALEEIEQKEFQNYDRKKEYVAQLVEKNKDNGENIENIAVNQENLSEKDKKKIQKKKEKKLKEVRKKYPVADENTLLILEGYEQKLEVNDDNNFEIGDLNHIHKKFTKEYVAENYVEARKTLDAIIKLATTLEKNENEDINSYVKLAQLCKEAFENALQANGLKIEYGAEEKLIAISEEEKNNSLEKMEGKINSIVNYIANNDYLNKKREIEKVMKLYSNWVDDEKMEEKVTIKGEMALVKLLKNKSKERNSVDNTDAVKKLIEGKQDIYTNNKELSDGLFAEFVKLETGIEELSVHIDLLSVYMNGINQDGLEVAKQNPDTDKGLFYAIQHKKYKNRLSLLVEKRDKIKEIINNIYNEREITKEQKEFMLVHGFIVDEKNREEIIEKAKELNNIKSKIEEEKEVELKKEYIDKVAGMIEEDISDEELVKQYKDTLYVAEKIKQKGIGTYAKTPMEIYKVNKINVYAKKIRAIILMDAYKKKCITEDILTKEERTKILKGVDRGITDIEIAQFAKSIYITALKESEDILNKYLKDDLVLKKWKSFKITKEVDVKDEKYVHLRDGMVVNVQRHLFKDEKKERTTENVKNFFKIESEIKKLENEKVKHENEVVQLKREVEQLEIELEKNKKQIEICDERLTEIKREINYDSKLDEIKTLRSSVKKYREIITKLKKELNEAEETKIRLENNDENQEEITKNGKNIERLNKAITKNNAKLEDFEKQLKEKTDKLEEDKSKTEYKKNSSKKSRCKEFIEENSNMLTVKKGKLTEKQKHLDEINDKLLKYEQEGFELELANFMVELEVGEKVKNLAELNEVPIFRKMSDEEFRDIITKLARGKISMNYNDGSELERHKYDDDIKDGIKLYKEKMHSYYSVYLFEKYGLKLPEFEKIEKNYEEIITDLNQVVFDKDLELRSRKVLDKNEDSELLEYMSFYEKMRQYVLDYKKVIENDKGVKGYKELKEKYNYEIAENTQNIRRIREKTA